MKYRNAMIAAGMIDEIRPQEYVSDMGLASVPSQAVPEKIRTAEAWRQAGARLRELAPDVYEAIFSAIVAELEETRVDMLESYLLT